MSESNIKVAVKMRPLIKREIDKRIPPCWKMNGSMLVDTVIGTNEFAFDLAFDENSTTSELYDKVARPIVCSALAGVNGTVFAYGQTSSGKTHTMMGDEDNDGLMLMAIKHIFNEVQSSNIEFVLRVGFIELYNEKVYDLYDPDNVDLKMMDKNNDAYVDCKEVICKSVDDMYTVIKIGNKNKKIGDTDMNDRSSRSHTIFRISIESIDAVSEKAKISNLNLVDLAGSERASQTGATGTRFVEGAHINKSLLSLSKVVNKLINKDNCHINYRDSKLTRYLQSSLGGNAMAAIICTICPTALDETISTLYFAQRAMKVTNKPRVNEIISDATMIKQLHNQIKALKVELEKAKSEANSTVPRLLQELSLHQGQILNYRKAEMKAKLRRRTWTTFDNELAVISETTPLVLNQQTSMCDLRSEAVAPMINMVTSDRGIGQFDYDPTNDIDKISDEFDFKSKYMKLLHDYEELQEFTDWENKLGIEPDVESDYKVQITSLEQQVVELQELLGAAEKEPKSAELANTIRDLEKEKGQLHAALTLAQQEKDSVEYLYESHQKKAEQREKDLLSMVEDLKTGDMTRSVLEEKNYAIQKLQEQLQDLSRANDEFAQKALAHGDVEQRVLKLEKVEVELEELKNTITVLTNTILTLENEKKEMSIRFNESMSASTLEIVASVGPAPINVGAPNNELAISVAGDLSKLQTENDELSTKVMELIEENDDLKQRAQELAEKLNERPMATHDEVNCEESKKWAEERIRECEARISDLQASEAALKNQFAECAQQLQTAEEQLKESGELQSSVEQTTAKLSEASSEIRMLEQQLQESHAQLTHLEAVALENSILKQSNEKLLAEVEYSTSVKESLCTELEKINKEHQEKVACIERHLEIIAQVKGERDAFCQSLSEAERRISELVAANEESIKSMTDFQEVSQLRMDELAKIRALEKQIEEDKGRLCQLDDMVQSKCALEMELEKLQIDRDALFIELNASIQKSNEMADEKDALQRDIEKATEDLQSMILERDCLSNELKSKVSIITQMERNNEADQSEVETNLKEAQMELARISSEFENKSALYDQLQKDHEELVSNMAKLSKQFAEAKSSFERHIETLTEELKRKEEDREVKLEEQRKNFDESKLIMENRIESLHMDMQAIQEKMAADFAEQKVNIEQEVQQLKAELELKCEELEMTKKQVDANSLAPGHASQEELRLSAELDTQLQRVHVLTQELATLKVTLQETETLVQEKEAAVSSSERLRRELEEKTLNIKDLEDLLESESAQVTLAKQALRENLDRMEKEKSELESQLFGAQRELAEKQVVLTDLQEEHQQQQMVAHELKERVLSVEKESSKNLLDSRAKEARIEELLKQMQQLEEAAVIRSQELSAAKGALEDVVAKNEVLQATVSVSDSERELVSQLQRDKDQLATEVASLSAKQQLAEERFQQLGHQLDEAEAQKQELDTKLKAALEERERLTVALETANQKRSAAEEKTRDVQQKHGILQERIATLEQELVGRDQQMAALGNRGQESTEQQHGEEVAKLQGHIKKLRAELNELQKKEPRKARRSSAFDSNRHLFGVNVTTETQTDPVNELCQCAALNEKVNELKKSNMLKDLQMVELREAEKRSPMLLENYSLKKRLVTAKEAEANHAKEMEKLEQRLYQAVKQGQSCKVCDNKKTRVAQCQTLPDGNLERIADLRRELHLKTSKYSEAKEIVFKQQDKIKGLEEQLTATRHANGRGTENDPNLANQKDFTDLRRKYETVKAVVEKRYHRIVQLEKDLEETRRRNVCSSCLKPSG